MKFCANYLAAVLNQESFFNEQKTKLNVTAYFINQELIDIEGKIHPCWGGRLILFIPDSALQHFSIS